jgi:hypothetical protein
MALEKKQKKEILVILSLFLVLEPLGLLYSKYFPRSFYSVYWHELSELPNADEVAITTFFGTSFCYVKPQQYNIGVAPVVYFKKGPKELTKEDAWHLTKKDQSISLSFTQDGTTFFLSSLSGSPAQLITSSSVSWWAYDYKSDQFSFADNSGYYLSCGNSGGLVLSGKEYLFTLFDYSVSTD